MRGAPAIAIVGCLSLTVELIPNQFSDKQTLADFVINKLEYLVTSRPTAVNMQEATKLFTKKVKDYISQADMTVEVMKNK